MSTQPEESSSTPSSNSSFNTASAPRSQPSNNNNRNSSRRNYLFVHRLIVAILLLFVTVSVVNFIAWRTLNPIPPIFQVNSFHISSTTPFNSSTLNHTYYYRVVFAITNPNKKLKLFLDRFEVFVFHGKTKVSSQRMTLMPPDLSVYYPEKNSPRDFPVRGRMLMISNFLPNNKNEVINFDVKMSFRIRFLAWNWLPKRESMRVHCSHLSVKLLSAKGKGDLIGGREQCSVL
ncbi:hypothetical protein CCACVL1_05331 [Corchorus capsularis]|uniref:Late embryogenesis abundant protein, LEA-14 n=1 Tax=Corchorus capsularis TaxID=210143 RepID=A0A1R3JLG6_COCAP|nr:hypothetical protein CCACVL1_05331 [Corchorus capsularis]